MATVKIYLDSRAAQGEAPLKLAVNHGSKTAMIPLGIKVSKEQWNKAQQAVVKHPNARSINPILTGAKLAAEREILKLSERLSSMDVKDIRDRIWEALDPSRKKSTTFLSRLERYASLQDNKNTRDTFLWCAKRLHTFDPEIGKRTFEDINTDYLKELDASLGLAQNSKSILFRNIRTVFNDAIDAGITSSYPFKSYRIKSAPTRKKALSLEQLKSLSKVDNEYVDIFMLMFYLRGINIGDLLKAKENQIVNGRFEYRRSKVDVPLSVKIEPEMQALIDKNRGKTHLLAPLDRYKDYKDYLHHMNHALKKYVPRLSSNYARHSWASVGISLDIPKETISRGMGHSLGSSVTDIYIDFDMKKVDEANRKIIDAVCR